MFVIIGMLVVLGGVLGGYMMHHGQLGVLLQPSEVLIIGGAAIGSILVMAPTAIIKKLMGDSMLTFTFKHETPKIALERLATVYKILRVAQYEGATGLEKHIEKPKESDIF